MREQHLRIRQPDRQQQRKEGRKEGRKEERHKVKIEENRKKGEICEAVATIHNAGTTPKNETAR